MPLPQHQYQIRVYECDPATGSVPEGAEPVVVLGPVSAPDPWCAPEAYVEGELERESQ